MRKHLQDLQTVIGVYHRINFSGKDLVKALSNKVPKEICTDDNIKLGHCVVTAVSFSGGVVQRVNHEEIN